MLTKMAEPFDRVTKDSAGYQRKADVQDDERGPITSTSTSTNRRCQMFDHERLHVYQVSLEFVAWVFERTDRLKGHFRHARDELIRASQSIPRNIAEGNGKRSLPDRGRFFEIARGPALECAAVLDQLYVMKAFDAAESKAGKLLLQRIVSMLTKMTEPTDQIREDQAEYRLKSDAQDEERVADYEHEHG
jgi:four helix bundle protein